MSCKTVGVSCHEWNWFTCCRVRIEAMPFEIRVNIKPFKHAVNLLVQLFNFINVLLLKKGFIYKILVWNDADPSMLIQSDICKYNFWFVKPFHPGFCNISSLALLPDIANQQPGKLSIFNNTAHPIEYMHSFVDPADTWRNNKSLERQNNVAISF